MRKILALAALVSIFSPGVLGDCKCARPVKGETTHWGGNEVVVFVEKQPHKQLGGRVEMYDGRPIEGALVEIFTHPEYLLEDLPNAKREGPEQQRLGVCRTAADGSFCFRGLPKGSYELRSSIDSGWDVTHVHVSVDPKKGTSAKIRVIMQVGT